MSKIIFCPECKRIAEYITITNYTRCTSCNWCIKGIYQEKEILIPLRKVKENRIE
jgi:DNA-directed RNA polymerase subunit RPC12/RpoP